MARKTNKTSHVINLLTNRTGLTVDDIDQTEKPKEKVVRKQVVPSAEESVEEIIYEPAAIDVSEMIRINLERIERTMNRRGIGND